jgi:DNA-binding GntR family transcriptional regulator
MPRAYEVIAAAIRDKINGRTVGYAPGDRLPTINELAVEYGVSRATIDLAVLELKREGLVVGVQGGRMRVAGEPNGDDSDRDAA